MSSPLPRTATCAPALAPLPEGAGAKTSHFTGVSLDKCNRCWITHISAKGKQRHIGCFKDEIAAAKAYDEAARNAFGEFATLNFPSAAERERAAKWYDTDAACRFFGLTRAGWKNWLRAGVITGGRLVPSSRGGKRKVYTREELERIREELFGDDKLYKNADNDWHVPPGLVRRQEAWRMFGVEKVAWERWEREGRITCGMRIPGGPKLYQIEDIKGLLEQNGCFAPPYPDSDQPGCYRVPLSGRDIFRREAIIDVQSLPLIDGGTCAWGTACDGIGFVSLNHPDHPHGTPLRRVIMGVTHSRLCIRHVNGDPLDCRRENLAVRTVRQKVWNNRKITLINGKPPTSRYKGVFWETWTGKWRARILAEGKNHSLGRFDDEIHAAEAYDIAARHFFGEHAWLNFPDGERRGSKMMTHSRAAA